MNKIYNKLEEDFFENIDSEPKAYYVGILLADGQNKIRSDSGKHIVRLALKSDDRQIIEEFKKALKYNGNILKAKNPNYPDNEYSEIRIQNEKLAHDLERHNFIPNKSLRLEFPNTIPDILIKDFIRGFMDGDGCISSGLSRNKKYKEYMVRFYTTEMFAIKLKETVMKLIEVNMSIYKDKTCKNDVSVVCKISGNKQVYKFCKWIYSDSSLFMKRKKEKYMDLIKQYNTLYNKLPD